MSFFLRSLRIAAGGLCLALLVAAVDRAGAGESDVAAGFRKLTGRHITLVTDVPPSAEVDELPQAFDAAFPQWCEYFSLDPAEHADWHVTGYLVQSKERFQQAGYWRGNLPPFLNGFSTGKELWLYNQTSPYYRRHLLLHEGVHSFMYMLIGTEGPPWYMEGIAELLATHRWREGKITVNYFPRAVDEVPGLGRIKLVQDDVAAGKGLSVDEVLAYDSHAHLQVQPYAWSWALAAFLDGHPRYRERFRQAADLVRQGKFAERFRRLFAADWCSWPPSGKCSPPIWTTATTSSAWRSTSSRANPSRARLESRWLPIADGNRVASGSKRARSTGSGPAVAIRLATSQVPGGANRAG